MNTITDIKNGTKSDENVPAQVGALSILFVDDSPNDILLIRRQLIKQGLNFRTLIAGDRDSFLKLLTAEKPDVILCDHYMPMFDSMTALHILREQKSKAVFILVTGTVSDEYAAAIIKAGADDFILKGKYGRLRSAIDGALHARKLQEERNSLLEQLRNSEEQLRMFTTNRTDLIEQERAELARDIHDQLGQELAGIRFAIMMLRKSLPSDDKKAHQIADNGLQFADQSIQTMRRIATQLRPTILDSLGLLDSLRWLVTEFSKKTSIKCSVFIPEQTLEADRKVSINVFRICQECFNNIAKHAEASAVELLVMLENNDLVIRIRDNGKGSADLQLHNPFSMGIVGIRERAGNIGAAISFQSEPAKGTEVLLKVPASKLNNEVLTKPSMK